MRIDLTEKEYKLVFSRKTAVEAAARAFNVAQEMLRMEGTAFAEVLTHFSEPGTYLGSLEAIQLGKDAKGFYFSIPE